MGNTKQKKRERKTYDWDAIEKEYRLGQKSLRTLSTEFGPSPGAISKRAKKYGWTQDKTKEVLQKTRAALLKETPPGNTEGNTPTREDIDRAVQSNIEVIRGHRASIKKAHDLVSVLAGQLENAAELRDELETAAEEETAADSTTKRRTMMMKAVSLPTHAGVLRDLTMALKNLIPLERQAFNLDAKPEDEPDSDLDNIDPATRSILEAIKENVYQETDT